MWNIIKKQKNLSLLLALVILLIAVFVVRKSNFIPPGTVIRSDRTINTTGYEARVDKLIKSVLENSGYQLNDLRDSKLTFGDEDEVLNIQLFVLKREKDAWNDTQKIIEIDALKDERTGDYFAKKITLKNSRDDLGRSTIMDSQSFFDNFYKPRNWAEQKRDWKELSKSWEI